MITRSDNPPPGLCAGNVLHGQSVSEVLYSHDVFRSREWGDLNVSCCKLVLQSRSEHHHHRAAREVRDPPLASRSPMQGTEERQRRRITAFGDHTCLFLQAVLCTFLDMQDIFAGCWSGCVTDTEHPRLSWCCCSPCTL